jgi:hypothetical protein
MIALPVMVFNHINVASGRRVSNATDLHHIAWSDASMKGVWRIRECGEIDHDMCVGVYDQVHLYHPHVVKVDVGVPGMLLPQFTHHRCHSEAEEGLSGEESGM